MEDFGRDRNLNDFLNELKVGSPRAGNKPPRNYTDPLQEYNSIHLQPDLVNTIESLKLSVQKNSERIRALEEKQQSFLGHLTELSDRFTQSSGKGNQDVIQKVENFMNYYVAKVDEKISMAERKMEMERNRVITETEKPATPISSHPNPLASNPNPPNYHNPSSEAPHPSRPNDFIQETNRKVETLTDRVNLSDEMLVRYIDKQNKQYKKLKKGTVPRWLYLLNIILLLGILMFLVQHFLSNYKIVVKPDSPSAKESAAPSSYAIEPIEEKPMLPVYQPVMLPKRMNIRAKALRNISVNKVSRHDYAYQSGNKKSNKSSPLRESKVYLAIDE